MMLTVETWPLDKITPYDKNAKLHHVEWIAKSISEFSIDQPIVVDGQGVIIKGHGRLKAAKQLGLTEFPVVVRTDLTPEQIRLARIADNRSAEGGWDSDLLGAELNDLLNALPDYDFDSLGLTDDWTQNLGLVQTLDFQGDGHAGDSPWARIGEKDETSVLFRFGEVVCNIPCDVYDNFYEKVKEKEIAPVITHLLTTFIDSNENLFS